MLPFFVHTIEAAFCGKENVYFFIDGGFERCRDSFENKYECGLCWEISTRSLAREIILCLSASRYNGHEERPVHSTVILNQCTDAHSIDRLPEILSNLPNEIWLFGEHPNSTGKDGLAGLSHESRREITFTRGTALRLF